MLVIVSAPSGTGKTTLCRMLMRDFNCLELSISSTTRAPRGFGRDAEVPGKDYVFISKKEFEEAIKRDEFAEWAEVHGNYYGTSKKTIEGLFQKGKSVLLDIDVQGAELLRKAYPGQNFSVFISPPSIEELERRLRARQTDSDNTINTRLNNAKIEMAESSHFDVVIVNDDLEKAYKDMKEAVEKQLAK